MHSLDRSLRARCVSLGTWQLVLVATLAGAGVACGDATGPGSPVVVAVHVEQFRGPSLRYTPDSEPTIGCGADVRATATGSGTATWLRATVDFFGDKGGKRLLGTATFPDSDVQSAWGQPDIAAGESQRSRISAAASEPFHAVVHYSYRPGSGPIQSADLDIDCGPAIPADTPAPSVTALAVQSDTSPLQPGGTLRISYTATSTVGLWETIVRMTGPCDVKQVLPDSLKRSITRTVRIPIPAGCRLGIPIGVSVAPEDAAFQSSTRALPTGIVLVDRTPPVIDPLFFTPDGVAGTELSGVFFGDDSIHELFNASDYGGLSAVVWEFLPSGVRDSLLVTGLSTLSETAISIPAGVTGPIQLRVFARDAAGLTSDTVTVGQGGGAVVYPALDLRTRSATISGEVRDVAIDTRRGLLYLLQTNQKRIAVLALSSMSVTAMAPMPFPVTRMDLMPSGDTLVVLFPGQGALGIIDLKQSTLQPAVVPLTAYDTAATSSAPPDLRTAANGKIFVSLPGSGPNTSTLLEVDPSTGVQRIRTDAGSSGIIGSGAMTGSLDHSVVLLTGGATYDQRYDAGTDQFGAQQSFPSGAGNISVDADGSRVAIDLDVFDASLHFLRTVNSPVGPAEVPVTALSAAGDVVYQILWPGVVRSRVADGAILDRIANPIRPNMLRASADGTLLVTIESESSTTSQISVIDLP